MKISNHFITIKPFYVTRYICVEPCVWMPCILYFPSPHSVLFTTARNCLICHVLNINIDSTGLYLLGSRRFNNLTIGHSSSVVSSNNCGIYASSGAKPPLYSKFHFLASGLVLTAPLPRHVCPWWKLTHPVSFWKENKLLPCQAIHYAAPSLHEFDLTGSQQKAQALEVLC